MSSVNSLRRQRQRRAAVGTAVCLHVKQRRTDRDQRRSLVEERRGRAMTLNGPTGARSEAGDRRPDKTGDVIASMHRRQATAAACC